MDESRVTKLVQDINSMSPEQRSREIAGLKLTMEEAYKDKTSIIEDIEFFEETLKRLEK